MEIEENYSKKCKGYYGNLNENVTKKYYPWINNNSLLTPYHTIKINKEKHTDIRKSLLKAGISSIQNPTYKIFNHKYQNKYKDEYFNSSLLYLPSLANMNNDEMKQIKFSLE